MQCTELGILDLNVTGADGCCTRSTVRRAHCCNSVCDDRMHRTVNATETILQSLNTALALRLAQRYGLK